jgi:glycosyltransferase involved in cell wall biosynthesis
MGMTLVSCVENPAEPATEEFEISVVMPCLNEAKTVGGCVDKALLALRALGIRREVVIADNGSNDGSQQIARDHGAHVVNVARQGYRDALRAGIQATRWRYIITWATLSGQLNIANSGTEL